MNLTIQSIRFDADRKLEAFIAQKAQKLSTFFDHIIDVQVYLRLEKNKELGNKLVEFKVLVPGDTIVVNQRATTFEEATLQAVETAKRQVRKYKEQLRAHA